MGILKKVIFSLTTQPTGQQGVIKGIEGVLS